MPEPARQRASRSATRSRSTSPRSPTAVTASPATRARCSSSGTPSPASGCSPGSPRPAPASGSSGRMPSRSSPRRRTGSTPPCPWAGPGLLRWLRPPARRAAPTARPQGRRRPRADGPAGAPRRRRRGRAGARGRRRPRLAHPGRVRRRRARAGRACAGTARTTSCPIDHCRIAAPGVDRLSGHRAAHGPGPTPWMPSRPPSVSRSPWLPCPGARRPGRPRAGRRRVAGTATARSTAGRPASSRSPPAASGRCTRAPPARSSPPSWRPPTPRPGERALDLYAGVGLFAAALADAVGRSGQVLAVESDPEASRARPRQPRGTGPTSPSLTARVDDAFGVARPSRRGSARQRGSRPRKPSRSALLPTSADVVVLDPPRTGAGRGRLRRDRGAAPAGRRLRRLRPGRAGARHGLPRAAWATGSTACGPSTPSR